MATLAPSSESPELGQGKSSLSLFPTSPSVPLPGFPVLGPGKPLGYRKPQHSGLWGKWEGCLTWEAFERQQWLHGHSGEFGS